jgi:hypothetical protein
MKKIDFTLFALFCLYPAYGMEIQQFQNLFKDTRKPLNQWDLGNTYLKTINNIFQEARNKKEALIQLQASIAQRRADDILNHILIYGNKASTIRLNDETLQGTFNNLMTVHATTLLNVLNIYEALCKADILRIELALESRIGMCSDCSDTQQIIKNTQLSVIEGYWSNTFNNLDVIKLNEGERKLLELLVRKEPVLLEDFQEPLALLDSKNDKF